MSALDLRTGYACNNRCRFCDQGDLRERVPDATTEAIRTALTGAADVVWFAGGEVTSRRDLPTLVGAAKDAGYRRIGIQTNGRILAAAGAAAALRRAGLTDAAVAVHSHVAAVHDWLTQVPGSHAQALAAVRRLREAGVSVQLATVMTRSAVEALPALAALAVRLGVERHRWIACRAQGAAASGTESSGAGDRAGQGLVPRLAMLRTPLAAALALQADRRVDAETVGVPLCALGAYRALAGDRLDAAAPVRAFPAGLEEEIRRSVKGPPCASCPIAAACRGVDEAYVARWGWAEVAELRGVPLGDAAVVAVVGTTRAMRQALVRLAADRDREVVFEAEAPWARPGLATLVREAVRLGFRAVGVRGRADGIEALEEGDRAKLEGLAWVEVADAAEVERVRAVVGAGVRVG